MLGFLLGLHLSAAAYASSTNEATTLIERGRYLATLGNCVSCHTAADGAPMAGGRPIATPFGTIHSTNITPDVETGIGRWTRVQFRQAMREGIRPNGEHLYPAFPYTSFAKLADGDVDAMFEYLRSVAAVRATPPENDLAFPFSVRSLLAVWKALYFDDSRFVPRAEKSAEWNRGAYLVEGLGHCGACHTPRNVLGAGRAELRLTGGTYVDTVPSGALRKWSAVNLTSAATGLRAWSHIDIVAYLKTGLNSFATTFGPMNDVVMNSTRHLTDADASAIATYLKDLDAKEQGSPTAVAEEQRSLGESLYSVHCATCHLPNGRGSLETGPAMVGNPVVQAHDPASLINVILYGPQLPAPGPPVQRTHMDAYAGLLSDEEIAALASFLRDAWGNRAGAVSSSQVADQR